MRISGVDAIAIDIPLGKNFGGSTYAVLKRSTVITRLRTDDGLVSEVYNGDNREAGPEIVRLIRDELGPLVKGESIFAGERIWSKLFARTLPNRDRKTLLEAIACIDCAVWDVVGKATGAQRARTARRLHRQGARSSRSAATTWRARRSPTSAARWRLTALAGMAGCKFKVGGSRRRRRMRSAFGRRARPRAPISCSRSTPIAAGRPRRRSSFARLVEPLDIRWFEEPCHWYDDAAQMARVRAQTRIPITAGQSEITSHAVRRLIDAGAVDIVNYDASEGGGVTDWRRAAALCAASGVAVAHHEESQIAQHLISAIPHGTCIECFADPERDPVWQTDVGEPAGHRGWHDGGLAGTRASASSSTPP